MTQITRIFADNKFEEIRYTSNFQTYKNPCKSASSVSSAFKKTAVKFDAGKSHTMYTEFWHIEDVTTKIQQTKKHS